MLDNGTKRRIDNARQVLVGKVPDPKTQVEQITTALIYKFMDDIDQESIELGGEASFFVDEYEKYAWPKVMDKSLGGYDRLTLYAEAITRISQNPNLPQLFRDIFKDAFLPYRDPETLNLFLKEIDGFTYDHSERLGDAFEYLLSVLGSQGAAGQFRTPRHIIDFIVEVVDPTKTDTILDPACGTAGFLISAYKHILAKNQDKPLTPDEMQRLTKNFVGYDISPDMVRLSLVNMYLHKFRNPTIYEYDTLTSEDRWDDSFDVILANPPFMTPKGGIRPHSRFSVQANRSEVLFVDYIAEHLNPEGRAGVIVPEGIIFQSSTAYKELRRMLIEENYLYAVISLPGGVFNPYSGVKTSILLMDKVLAKQVDSILFVTIENDGFDLGAQRKKIEANDIPEALNLIKNYKADIYSEITYPSMAFVVKKAEFLATSDYSLSGERYREYDRFVKHKWPLVELKEIFSNSKETIDPNNKDGIVNYIGLENIQSNTGIIVGNNETEMANIKSAKKVYLEDDILFGRLRPNLNKAYLAMESGICSTDIFVLRCDRTQINPFLYSYVIRSQKFNRKVIHGVSGAQLPRVNWAYFSSLKLPLPPIEYQNEVAYIIECYQKVIDGASQVIENYIPQIKIESDWPLVELGEVAKTEYGHNESAKEEANTRFVRITDIDKNGLLRDNDVKYINLSEESKPYLLQKGDVVVARTGATYGKTLYFDEDYQAVFAGYLIRINFDPERVLNKYYWCFAQSEDYNRQKANLVSGSGQPQFNAKAIQKIKIPLPPDLETQKEIVSQIEAEQNFVDANKQLNKIFKKKIEDKIAEVWGEVTEE